MKEAVVLILLHKACTHELVQEVCGKLTRFSLLPEGLNLLLKRFELVQFHLDVVFSDICVFLLPPDLVSCAAAFAAYLQHISGYTLRL